MDQHPHIILLNRLGHSGIGFITVAEINAAVPFDIRRVYWTYFTPNEVFRGGHAHHELCQILVAVSGSITIETESQTGEKESFTLSKPDEGLFMPPPFWHTMRFSHNAVLLSLASMEYSEADYIRNYQEFKQQVDF